MKQDASDSPIAPLRWSSEIGCVCGHDVSERAYLRRQRSPNSRAVGTFCLAKQRFAPLRYLTIVTRILL